MEKQILDTKISFTVFKPNEKIDAHLWILGEMTQKDILDLENNVFLISEIEKIFGKNIKFEINEVVFQNKNNNTEYYNTIIQDTYKNVTNINNSTRVYLSIISKKGDTILAYMWLPNQLTLEDVKEKHINTIKNKVGVYYDTENFNIINTTQSHKLLMYYYNVLYTENIKNPCLDTKIYLELRRKEINGITSVFNLHVWLQSKISEEVAKSTMSSYNMEKQFNSYFGSIDYNVIRIEYLDNRKETEEYFDIFIDSTVKKEITSNLPNQKQLEDLTDLELINMKDRIDEILFKRENKLSDDEYSFFIENEDIVSLENVKELYNIYKNDKFKLKKIRIKNNLKV